MPTLLRLNTVITGGNMCTVSCYSSAITAWVTNNGGITDFQPLYQ